MEFDNRINLKETGRCDLVSDLSPEALHKRLWDLFSASAAHVGDAGAGEFWLDYPDLLRTRHLVVNLSFPGSEESSDDAGTAEEGASRNPGHYSVRFRGGSKLNYLGDVLVMALALLAFWCLSKLLVPQPPVLAIAGFVLCTTSAIGLFFWAGRKFGEKETDELIEKLRS